MRCVKAAPKWLLVSYFIAISYEPKGYQSLTAPLRLT